MAARRECRAAPERKLGVALYILFLKTAGSRGSSSDLDERISICGGCTMMDFTYSTRIASDPKHSADEDRFIAVGRTITGRPGFVATSKPTQLPPLSVPIPIR